MTRGRWDRRGRRPASILNPARLVRCSRNCGTLTWLAGALPVAADATFVCSACSTCRRCLVAGVPTSAGICRPCREQVREDAPYCPDDLAGGVHRDGCSCEDSVPAAKLSATTSHPVADPGGAEARLATAPPGPSGEARP